MVAQQHPVSARLHSKAPTHMQLSVRNAQNPLTQGFASLHLIPACTINAFIVVDETAALVIFTSLLTRIMQ